MITGVPCKQTEIIGSKILSCPDTKQVLYYTDNSSAKISTGESEQETVNAGIYLISTKVYNEFDKCDILEMQ